MCAVVDAAVSAVSVVTRCLAFWCCRGCGGYCRGLALAASLSGWRHHYLNLRRLLSCARRLFVLASVSSDRLGGAAAIDEGRGGVSP